MPTPRDVLAASRADALALSSGVGVKHVVGSLEKAAEELKAKLEAMPISKAGTYTHAQMQATLEQLQGIIVKLLPGVKGAVVSSARTATQEGVGGTLGFLAAQHRAFAGTKADPLPLSEAFVFDTVKNGVESSVLRRLASGVGPQKVGILARYGMETLGHFEGILSQGILTKKPWEDVKQQLIEKSPFLQGAPRFWAERIVRTESMFAYNKAGLDSADEANAELGDMCKILSATFDDRTASDSYAVHGQIRRMEEPFESWFGLYQHPPNRPNDREIVVPHRVSWPLPPYLTPKTDSEVVARWKQEKRKGSPPPRPNMSTIPREWFGQGLPEEEKPKPKEAPKELPPKDVSELPRPKVEPWPAPTPPRARLTPEQKAKKSLGLMPQVEGEDGWFKHDFPYSPPSALDHDLTLKEQEALMDVLDGKLPSLISSQKVEIDDLHFQQTQLKEEHVLKAIDAGGSEKQLPLIVKKGGKYIVEMGQTDIMADSLLGKLHVTADLVDLDNPGVQALLKAEAAAKEALEKKAALEEEAAKLAKKKATAEKAKATKAANKAKKAAEEAAKAGLKDIDISAKPVDPKNILHNKTGGQKGSNEGGFYKGADGVDRYVKKYSDAGQAYGESISNAIYRSLGHGAPESEVFEHEGKLHHAAKIIEGGKTLAEVGLDAKTADQILDGFAADVLLANWDVVGMSKDNIMLAGGKVHRIDNGGSLLMRAKAGRKDKHLLHELSEWENFFGSKNPSYREVMNKAGHDDPADFHEKAKKGIEDILALRDKHGGWSSFVDKVAPSFKGKDRDDIVEMLEKRTDLLKKKLPELKPKPKPEPQITPKGKFAPPKTTFKELAKAKVKAPPPNKNDTPTGEPAHVYRERAEKEIAKATQASRDAIRAFTGSPYTQIREAISKGDTKSYHGKLGVDINHAFEEKYGIERVKGTIFRGIGVQPEVLDSYCQLEEGKPMHLGPYMGNPTVASASRDQEVALRFARNNGPKQILFQIESHRGIAIETISGIKTELEILTNPDAHFRITKRYVANMGGEGYAKVDHLVLHLEEMTAEEIAEAREAGVIPQKPKAP